MVCLCDFPKCNAVIDRGLAFVCGDSPGETEFGCGRYFCGDHMKGRTYGRGKDAEHKQVCGRCKRGERPWPMKPDLPNALEEVEFNPSFYTGLGAG